MIILGIVKVIAQILSYAIGLLPDAGKSLDHFVAMSQGVFGFAFLLDGYFPVAVMGVCISILWAAHSLEFVGNFIIKVYKLIPGKMT